MSIFVKLLIDLYNLSCFPEIETNFFFVFLQVLCLSQYLQEAHNNYKELKNKLQETRLISGDRSFNAISEEMVTDVARLVKL